MKSSQNPEGISTVQIYNCNHRRNQSWSIPEYLTPREYFDPARQVQQRVYASQKKGQSNRNYVTKRGFYMDHQLKVASTTPGPYEHGSNAPWSVLKLIQMSKNKKVDSSLIKRTYLQLIQRQQKNHKKPGVCTYSLEKSQKKKDAEKQSMKKTKHFKGQKHFFHDDINYLGGCVPGSGQYNPHDNVLKIKQNKTNNKYWIKKHKEQGQKQKKKMSKIPAPGTYTPLSTSFTTFDFLLSKQKRHKKQKSRDKSTGFGTDTRFEYTRTDRKASHEKRPDPMTYNTAYEWRTSKNKASSQDKPWNEMISKGSTTMSLYH